MQHIRTLKSSIDGDDRHAQAAAAINHRKVEMPIMIKKMSSKILAATGFALAAANLVMMTSANATTISDFSPASCTTANCSSESISASMSAQGLFVVPWEIQVSSDVGNCLRLETTAASADLEIVAVSPSGSVFRDDDGGVGDLSLVKIGSAERGWYTVQVSTWNGAAIEASFTLRYGR